MTDKILLAWEKLVAWAIVPVFASIFSAWLFLQAVYRIELKSPIAFMGSAIQTDAGLALLYSIIITLIALSVFTLAVIVEQAHPD